MHVHHAAHATDVLKSATKLADQKPDIHMFMYYTDVVCTILLVFSKPAAYRERTGVICLCTIPIYEYRIFFST